MLVEEVKTTELPGGGKHGIVSKFNSVLQRLRDSFSEFFYSTPKLDYVLGALNEETIFNLKNSPKGKDYSGTIKVFVESNLNVKYGIKSLLKENKKDDLLVLARVPVSLKLTKDVIDIILIYKKDPQQAQKLHYSKLTMEEGQLLGSLVRQFPEDLKIIQTLLEIVPEIGYNLRQKFSSHRSYGGDLYITKK